MQFRLPHFSIGSSFSRNALLERRFRVILFARTRIIFAELPLGLSRFYSAVFGVTLLQRGHASHALAV
jgi:hypothetical protein